MALSVLLIVAYKIIGVFRIFNIVDKTLAIQETKDAWRKFATEIKYFQNNTITALKIVDDDLYVASTIKNGDSYLLKMYIYNMKNGFCSDVTSKLGLNDTATITKLVYDHFKKQIWITTNGNGRLSDCYDLKINLIERYSDSYTKGPSREEPAYLDQDLSGELKKIDRRSGEIFEYDDFWAVIGFYKGNAYIYSFKNKKLTLVYQPSWVYNWPMCGTLNRKRAFIGTGGYGLIIVDFEKMETKRVGTDDTNQVSIRALAADDKYLWITSTVGLFKIEIDYLLKGVDTKK